MAKIVGRPLEKLTSRIQLPSDQVIQAMTEMGMSNNRYSALRNDRSHE
jgi:hypothetical protein